MRCVTRMLNFMEKLFSYRTKELWTAGPLDMAEELNVGSRGLKYFTSIERISRYEEASTSD